MKSFILYTSEGSTYSPENVLCENFQILGFAQGESQNQACDLFISQNSWIIECGFSIDKIQIKQVVE